jgi:hypothetical protein
VSVAADSVPVRSSTEDLSDDIRLTNTHRSSA